MEDIGIEEGVGTWSVWRMSLRRITIYTRIQEREDCWWNVEELDLADCFFET